MRTFHGIRQFNNIVYNAEPVDLREPWAFLFQYTFLFDAYEEIDQITVNVVVHFDRAWRLLSENVPAPTENLDIRVMGRDERDYLFG